jgi:tryptophan 2,3-dioxygenase
MAFDGRMSYGDYLCSTGAGAQNPRTDAHDEMLFIIQHQTSELWMKLAIHEISARRAGDRCRPAAAGDEDAGAGVADLRAAQFNAWDVLRTMTPSDYTHFRRKLGQSSGFQSWQYRMIEFTLGNRNHAMMRPHAHVPGMYAKLEARTEQSPAFMTRRCGWRRGAACHARSGAVARCSLQTHELDDGVIAGWKQVYEAPEAHWALYEVAEKLVDLEDYFRRWRFNHVTTVERVIGLKRGTGGTGGTSYLKRMLDVELFPELWRVRTEL